MASICGLDLRYSREVPIAYSCEHDKKGNKSSAFIKCGEVFDYLHGYCLHKRENWFI
jgi:hypothetical protein